MVIYLSGPMSGLPLHNFPAFATAAKILRNRGYTVVSPHECEKVNHATPKPWTYYLRKDLIAMLQTCDTIVMLDGWQKSRGATLERMVAMTLGMDVKHYAEMV